MSKGKKKNLRFQAYTEAATDSWQGQKACILGISLGQEYHKGAQLEAIIEFADKHFETVVISIADSLQRFNLANKRKVDQEACAKDAISLGDEWFEKHREIIGKLGDKAKIIRYSDFVNTDAYRTRVKILERQYQTRPLFRESIKRLVDAHLQQSTFLEKYGIDENTSALSQKLIMEEIAIDSLIAERGYRLEFYPGKLHLRESVFSGLQEQDISPSLRPYWESRYVDLKLEISSSEDKEDETYLPQKDKRRKKIQAEIGRNVDFYSVANVRVAIAHFEAPEGALVVEPLYEVPGKEGYWGGNAHWKRFDEIDPRIHGMVIDLDKPPTQIDEYFIKTKSKDKARESVRDDIKDLIRGLLKNLEKIPTGEPILADELNERIASQAGRQRTVATQAFIGQGPAPRATPSFVHTKEK